MGGIRKLSAILVLDVVGYSRLAGVDEERTLARLRALRGDLIDPAVAAHFGRIVKGTGDGALVEFRSAVDAVRCAVEVQASMAERNAGVPREKRIEFRIGVHVGDVVEEDDGDLMGDGVNIAARLEGLAKPGAVCLSEDAYRQVKSRLEMTFTDLGARQLKNIAEPVRAYLVGDEPPERRPALRQWRVATLAALAILVVASAGGWRWIAAMPSTTAASSATSSESPPGPADAGALATAARPSEAPPAASVEPTAPLKAATDEPPPLPPSRSDDLPLMKPAAITPPDAEAAPRKVVRASAKRPPPKVEPASAPAAESASNAPQSCFPSAGEINGNHPACQYVHGVPPRPEPAQSKSAKNASNAPKPCILSVAELNGNHRDCESLHGVQSADGAGLR